MVYVRLNAMIMADVKATVQFLHVTKNLLKNMADVIPHCAKAVHIVSPCHSTQN